MTFIEGHDPTATELPCDARDGQISQTQVQIRVPTVQLQCRLIVVSVQSRTLVPPGSEVLEERPARRWAEPLT
jgi:hypothetical protein